MKKITITIRLEELMADIAKWSYTIGEPMDDSQAKVRHLVQGATDRGHDVLIKSSFDQSWVDILDTLSAYFKTHQCTCGDPNCECADNCDTSSSTVTEETEITSYDTEDMHDYKCIMYFPDDVYEHIDYRIAITAKTYMLMKARAEWCLLVGRDANPYMIAAEQAKNRLRVTINTRTKMSHLNTSWSNFIKF